MSNRVENGVFVFYRFRSGLLNQIGHYLTGGAGAPTLASQNAMAVIRTRRLLLALNSGSNDMTVFRIEARGLSRIQTIRSGGIQPVSLAVFDDLVYVLNAGDVPNISGFKIGEDDLLQPITGARRDLSGGPDSEPSVMVFSPGGDLLTVTEKKCHCIETFTIDLNGVPGRPIRTQSTGSTPSGMVFTNNGHVLIAESAGNAAELGTVSSYNITHEKLEIITPNLRTTGTGSCCVVSSSNARFAYVLNSADATISSLQVKEDGSLILLKPVLRSFGEGSFPTAMTTAHGGRLLYVLDSGRSAIFGFKIDHDGSLVDLGLFGLLPPGVKSIAAF